ncbi:MAG: hypothetical protein IKL27_06335 [Oscillospiraceae bacterium]|nr:hypothetical protein [Oscillospiraceae bacterium]
MEPIINPWVFYFTSAADTLIVFAAIFGFAAAVIAIIAASMSLYALVEWGAEDKDYIARKAFAKKAAWVAVPLLVLAILVPGERTITKMIVAQNVTYERMDAAVDVVSEVYNDIIGILEPESGEEVSK